jgi:hypothetical protein
MPKSMSGDLNFQKFGELIYAEIRLPQNGSQRPAINLAVIRHNCLRERGFATHDN